MYELIFAGALILVASMTGGLTNSLAIRMLFRPGKPPVVLGRKLAWLQGAIPKNQERMAQSIGGAVGNRLLPREELSDMLSRPELREAYDEVLLRAAKEVAEREHGSVREILGPEAMKTLDGAISELLDSGMESIGRYLESDAFEEVLGREADALRAHVAEMRIGELLTPERRARLVALISDWLEERARSPALETAIKGYVGRGFDNLARDERPLQELIPSGFAEMLEQAISEYLPVALDHLGAYVRRPEVAASIEQIIGTLFKRFRSELNFFQGWVASIIINEAMVDGVVARIRKDGADKLIGLIHEERFRSAARRAIRSSIAEVMQRDLSGIFGAADSNRLAKGKAQASAWLIKRARDPKILEFAATEIGAALEKVSLMTWEEALGDGARGKVLDGIVRAARSPQAVPLYRAVLQKGVDTLLSTPVGRPSAWLPDQTPDRVRSFASDGIWRWIQAQVPQIVARMDIAARVERRLRRFPTRELESLVRSVARRELRLIVTLGWILGGLVGALMVTANRLIP